MGTDPLGNICVYELEKLEIKNYWGVAGCELN